VSETDLVRAILGALRLRRVWAWRANSGTIVLKANAKAQRRVVRGAAAGTPDILGVLPGGRLFGLEVKVPGGRVRPSQTAWHVQAAQHGVAVAVVHSISEALGAVDRWILEAA
jgi:hypothetical protein